METNLTKWLIMDNQKYTIENLVTTTTEYAENATVHGIKYIFEKVK